MRDLLSGGLKRDSNEFLRIPPGKEKNNNKIKEEINLIISCANVRGNDEQSLTVARLISDYKTKCDVLILSELGWRGKRRSKIKGEGESTEGSDLESEVMDNSSSSFSEESDGADGKAIKKDVEGCDVSFSPFGYATCFGCGSGIVVFNEDLIKDLKFRLHKYDQSSGLSDKVAHSSERMICLKFSSVSIVAIYAPAVYQYSVRKSFVARLHKWMRRILGGRSRRLKPTVLGGDFNIRPGPKSAVWGSWGQEMGMRRSHRRFSDVFSAILEDLRMVDIGSQFFIPSRQTHCKGGEIDHLMVDKPGVINEFEVATSLRMGFDHFIITAKICVIDFSMSSYNPRGQFKMIKMARTKVSEQVQIALSSKVLAENNPNAMIRSIGGFKRQLFYTLSLEEFRNFFKLERSDISSPDKHWKRMPVIWSHLSTTKKSKGKSYVSQSAMAAHYYSVGTSYSPPVSDSEFLSLSSWKEDEIRLLDEPFSVEEIRYAISGCKNASKDSLGLVAGVIRHLDDEALNHLFEVIYDGVRQGLHISDRENWGLLLDCAMSSLYKGGVNDEMVKKVLVDKHRAIANGGAVSKVLGKVVANRLNRILEQGGYLPDFQWGFRSGRGVPGAALIISRLMEDLRELLSSPIFNEKPVVQLDFLDLRKAFPSVSWEAASSIITRQGWRSTVCGRIVYEFPRQTKYIFHASDNDVIKSDDTPREGVVIEKGENNQTKYIVQTKNGIREGCSLSPCVFNLLSGAIFSCVFSQLAREGVEAPSLTFAANFRAAASREGQLAALLSTDGGTHPPSIQFVILVSILLFADDTVTASILRSVFGYEDEDERSSYCNRIVHLLYRMGLVENQSKRVSMPLYKYVMATEQLTHIGSGIGGVRYLGWRSNLAGWIEIKIESAWRAFFGLKTALIGTNLTTKEKLSVLGQVVAPILTWGTEFSYIGEKGVKLLEGAYQKMTFALIGVNKHIMKGKFNSHDIAKKHSQEPLGLIIWLTRMKFVGHVLRAGPAWTPVKTAAFGRLVLPLTKPEDALTTKRGKSEVGTSWLEETYKIAKDFLSVSRQSMIDLASCRKKGDLLAGRYAWKQLVYGSFIKFVLLHYLRSKEETTDEELEKKKDELCTKYFLSPTIENSHLCLDEKTDELSNGAKQLLSAGKLKRLKLLKNDITEYDEYFEEVQPGYFMCGICESIFYTSRMAIVRHCAAHAEMEIPKVIYRYLPPGNDSSNIMLRSREHVYNTRTMCYYSGSFCRVSSIWDVDRFLKNGKLSCLVCEEGIVKYAVSESLGAQARKICMLEQHMRGCHS